MKNNNSKKNESKVELGKRAIDGIMYSIENPIVAGVFTDHRLKPWKKLVTGLLMFSISVVAMYLFSINDNMFKFQNFLNKLFHFLPNSLNNILTPLVCMFVAGVSLVWFIKGLYRIGTCNRYLDTFDGAAPITVKEFMRAIEEIGSDKSNGNLSNLDSILSYRDSVMTGMGPEKASQLLVRTSMLDIARTGYYSESGAKKAISYLNSRLNGMSPQVGLE